MKNCEQFRELFEDYALGVLDAGERAALEAHLATACADCAKSVAEARWLVSQLAYSAPESSPSDMLKGRLMQTVRAEARERQSARRSKTSVPLWMQFAVAALLLFALYSAWDARLSQQRIRAANDKLAATETQLAVASTENAILTDPASARIALVPQGSSGPKLEATWHQKYGIVVTGQKVPVPPGDRVLQLWLIPKVPGGKPIPSVTLRPDAEGRILLFVPPPSEIASETKALAITEEPAGGSPQPTTTPRWVGGVS